MFWFVWYKFLSVFLLLRLTNVSRHWYKTALKAALLLTSSNCFTSLKWSHELLAVTEWRKQHHCPSLPCQVTVSLLYKTWGLCDSSPLPTACQSFPHRLLLTRLEQFQSHRGETLSVFWGKLFLPWPISPSAHFALFPVFIFPAYPLSRVFHSSCNLAPN